MIRVILYTFLGLAFGLLSGILYGYWRGVDEATLRIYGFLGLVAGLPFGVILGIIIINFRSFRHNFEYHRLVTYKLAPCAWCHKTGANLHIIPCRVCRGYGNVLTPSPRQRCAWCNRTGREMLGILRCSVCDGSGWAYGHADRR